MKIRHEHVSHFVRRGPVPPIPAIRRTMGKLVAAFVAIPEFRIAIRQCCQISCGIVELPAEMNDFAFALYPSLDCHHARAQHDTAVLLEE